MKYLYTISALLFWSLIPQVSQAQIVYTDIDPDVNNTYDLDVDNNGTVDYSFAGEYAPDGPSSYSGIHYTRVRYDYNYIFYLQNPDKMRIYEHGDTYSWKQVRIR